MRCKFVGDQGGFFILIDEMCLGLKNIVISGGSSGGWGNCKVCNVVSHW